MKTGEGEWPDFGEGSHRGRGLRGQRARVSHGAPARWFGWGAGWPEGARRRWRIARRRR